ncbi:zinc finger CCCH domain-containing protein 32 isoform X1 [Coffea arabica]|uniref:Zinc finger CCCH domain-containing protein 32 isoform X1 n=1 Tax=Coffea arabica TaxID=13443 RepID=A0A6P6WN64_COFAR|nr:zinc finger CCCH domain-containing protein 32-like isoform X1 [Coffea arabica]
MELYGRSNARKGLQQNRSREWAPAAREAGLTESTGRLGLWDGEAYPERPGMLECAYYMRTGVCGYGAKCRYNHPRDRASVGGSVSLAAADYPERVGEPDCQYYLRTGTCKFGASCKFHHPRNAGGSLISVSLNIYGYPLRLGEKECSYYLKTGQCKFGNTCKFHHPQPAGMSMPATAHPFYPTVQSPSALSEQYCCASTNYRVSRPPILTGSYVPGAYGPFLLHTGVVPVPNWGPYTGPITPGFSPGTQASVGATSLYGVSQLNSSATAFAGTYPTLLSDSNQKKQKFPERPGQPECQYYMRYGDCKFGPSCRFHHPPNLVVAKAYSALSPLGLPLRPGMQSCPFYLQKGHCKFGRNCKFDHPMGTVEYSPSASSLTDVPVTPYMLCSSTAMEGQAAEFVGSKLDLQITRDRPHGSSLSGSVGLTFSRTAPFLLSNIQISDQGSGPNAD